MKCVLVNPVGLAVVLIFAASVSASAQVTLTSKGVTSHQGWDIWSASFITPDGKIISGTGFNRQLIAESWIVTLP